MEKFLNYDADPFASFNIEKNVMGNLRDDLEMMKEQLHKNYGMVAE